MKNAWWLGAACLGLAVLLLAPLAKAEENEVKEEEIALDKVPEAVLKAAKEAVKGIVLSRAEKETKGNTTVYEFDGKAGEKFYEVKVSAEGKVLSVKEEKQNDNEKEEKGEKGKKKSGEKEK